jgi:hypothetical protein
LGGVNIHDGQKVIFLLDKLLEMVKGATDHSRIAASEGGDDTVVAAGFFKR